MSTNLTTFPEQSALFGLPEEQFKCLINHAIFAPSVHNFGAFYGLEVTPRRMLSDALRMKTPVEELYLAGQDALTPGIPGAMWGGFLGAANIDPKIFTHMRCSSSERTAWCGVT
jgi:hypothetical protein